MSYPTQMKEQTLGRGSFAIVSPSKDQQSPNTVVKKIQVKNHLSFSYMLNQSTILSLCQHPNIVSFHSSWLDQEERSFYIKMERLKKTISVEDLQGDLCLLIQWIAQICKALDYLHKRGIIHRDIKLENIMLGFQGEIKLIDFGVSIYKWMLPYEKVKQIGSPCFMAPEIFLRQPYNEQVDIYSLGVVIFTLIHRKLPFEGIDKESYWRNTLRNSVYFSKDCPQFFTKLIKKMLTLDPKKRITASQIIVFLKRQQTGVKLE